jgi:hypothetical protein
LLKLTLPFGFFAALRVSLEVILPDKLFTWLRAINIRTEKYLWLMIELIGVLARLVPIQISTKSEGSAT